MDDEGAEWVGELIQSLTLLKLDPSYLYLFCKGEGPGSLRELMVRPHLNPGMLYCPPPLLHRAAQPIPWCTVSYHGMVSSLEHWMVLNLDSSSQFSTWRPSLSLAFSRKASWISWLISCLMGLP